MRSSGSIKRLCMPVTLIGNFNDMLHLPRPRLLSAVCVFEKCVAEAIICVHGRWLFGECPEGLQSRSLSDTQHF